MKVAYLKLAIEGIQKYICSTGKLSEMIGGSQCISYIASEEFRESLLEKQQLEEDKTLSCLPGKYIVAQANAGALCLIMPDRDSARKFLQEASKELLGQFPGLPFYGAISEFIWSDDVAGTRGSRHLIFAQIAMHRI